MTDSQPKVSELPAPIPLCAGQQPYDDLAALAANAARAVLGVSKESPKSGDDAKLGVSKESQKRGRSSIKGAFTEHGKVILRRLASVWSKLYYRAIDAQLHRHARPAFLWRWTRAHSWN